MNNFPFLFCLFPIVIAFGALITTKQASEILNVDQRHVSRLAKKGLIPSQKIGRDILLEEADVRKYAANRRKPGRPKKE